MIPAAKFLVNPVCVTTPDATSPLVGGTEKHLAEEVGNTDQHHNVAGASKRHAAQ
jgi:hypothetical protein